MIDHEFKMLGYGRAGYSPDTEGEYVEEKSTGATITLTKSLLSITLPVDMEGDAVENYFEAERLLMALVLEALQLLDEWRDGEAMRYRRAYRDQCNQQLVSELPNHGRPTILALRALAKKGALPIGQSRFDMKEFLEILDSALLEEPNAAD